MADELQRLPQAALRAAQCELPSPSHPHMWHRLLRRRVRTPTWGSWHPPLRYNSGWRRIARRDRDVQVPVRVWLPGARTPLGGARRRGGVQVRGRRQRQGHGGGAQGVARRAPHRHRDGYMAAGGGG
jgi:hypothetical protein